MALNNGRYRSYYRTQFQQLKSPRNDQFGIPLNELRNHLQNQRTSTNLRDDQIDLLIREADQNGDQRITVEEFEELAFE
ncbi:hypothetical protein DICVIV_08406 [Dictyocaulus viviparus]|uniref:EF-hand domain-containing protein n=1 Tax=Dictyocaulus viviparus TaxID=29172 RepID=A0A0D8XLL1_DICVI|nr:hypothetical protein DICVIV_08406 [Dictyocaulus viviparus]